MKWRLVYLISSIPLKALFAGIGNVRWRQPPFPGETDGMEEEGGGWVHITGNCVKMFEFIFYYYFFLLFLFSILCKKIKLSQFYVKKYKLSNN